MADRDKISEVCDRYLTAVSAHDVDAVMTLYADNATVEDPVGSELKVGRDQIRGFYEAIFGAEFTTRRIGPVTVAGTAAAFQFRVDVPLGETALHGTSTDVMTFDQEGRILTMVAYADMQADPDAIQG